MEWKDYRIISLILFDLITWLDALIIYDALCFMEMIYKTVLKNYPF